jgi:alpha-tubulin suppressor-like RCC1 family protein
MLAAAWGCNGRVDDADGSVDAGSDGTSQQKDSSVADAADAADAALPECVPTSAQPCVRAVFGGPHAVNLCAVLDKVGATGVLECWGNAGPPEPFGSTSAIGGLDGGTSGYAFTPQIVSLGHAIKDLTIGFYASCSVDADGGGVRCWSPISELEVCNVNADGALGTGDGGAVTAPPATPILLGATMVRLFVEDGLFPYSHACARLEDGAVHCWGSNAAGQLGLPKSVFSKFVPTKSPQPAASTVFVGEYSTLSVGAGDAGVSFSGLIDDSCTGNDCTEERYVYTPEALTALGTDVLQVVSDGIQGTYCALRATKRVWCVGQNSNGWLAVDPNSTASSATALDVGLANVEEIATDGSGVICARTGSGKVLCWGHAATGVTGMDPFNTAPFTQRGGGWYLVTPTEVSGVTNAVQLAMGQGVGCARTRDGALFCWGWPHRTGTGSDPKTPFVSATRVTAWE